MKSKPKSAPTKTCKSCRAIMRIWALDSRRESGELRSICVRTATYFRDGRLCFCDEK